MSVTLFEIVVNGPYRGDEMGAIADVQIFEFTTIALRLNLNIAWFTLLVALARDAT